ncbi:cyclase family protein [Nocardioides terrigena]|uniref:cyclase family protein n=1 Tax=Nocardioides terrigena TaxID=424797 RepID=UPI00131F1896|nr:cyclase family protein [Nocardioides terrigena]
MYPSYDDLPVLEGTDLRHAWDHFGREDRLGTLNHLTERDRFDALALARTGRSVCLTLPLGQPDPPPYGRSSLVHSVYQANGFSWGDRVDGLDMQSSSQWDGLLHVRHKEHGFYGGRQSPPAPGDPLGIDVLARSGVVGRGVLLDVARHLGAQGAYDALERRAIDPEQLREIATAQDVALRPGDILCLRFGWHDAYDRLDAADRERVMGSPVGVGLSARPEMARFLWDARVGAVACDNPTVEVQPGDKRDGYLHHRLITMLGMPLGELFDFEELSELCAGTGRWEFLFVSVPLHLVGGVGSPANAIALV